jgi:hypothetical protein
MHALQMPLALQQRRARDYHVISRVNDCQHAGTPVCGGSLAQLQTPHDDGMDCDRAPPLLRRDFAGGEPEQTGTPLGQPYSGDESR